jgi:hypothetical protein
MFLYNILNLQNVLFLLLKEKKNYNLIIISLSH